MSCFNVIKENENLSWKSSLMLVRIFSEVNYGAPCVQKTNYIYIVSRVLK